MKKKEVTLMTKVICFLTGHRGNMKIKNHKATMVCVDCTKTFDYIQKV